jgi:hypothetical protein
MESTYSSFLKKIKKLIVQEIRTKMNPVWTTTLMEREIFPDQPISGFMFNFPNLQISSQSSFIPIQP